MTKYTNEKIPLVICLLLCLVFAGAIIVGGYLHGHMSVSAVFKNF